MALLDDLIGQLAGDPAARGSGPTRAGTSNMSRVMVALLPVVLAMLANRRRAGTETPATPTGSAARGGGGLGDVLGQVLGGGAGGLGGLLDLFRRAGFDDQVRSWVGRGDNQPLPPDALERVFGRDGLAELARRAGVSEGDAAEGLSQLMPEVVDRVTPDGRVPDDDSLLASVEALGRRLGV
jgi:uncharacterized protein YidB (DUF937 family)